MKEDNHKVGITCLGSFLFVNRLKHKKIFFQNIINNIINIKKKINDECGIICLGSIFIRKLVYSLLNPKIGQSKNKMGSQGHCAIFLLSLIFGLAISQLKIDIRNLKTKPKTEEILLQQADFNSLQSK